LHLARLNNFKTVSNNISKYSQDLRLMECIVLVRRVVSSNLLA